ncbi:MAG: M23 family metallopeptidase [Synechococcales bacterium]|nr:M23 family metallopeptidase [Synechococcales bacterium]
MRRTTPEKYTILIARTGRLPLTLSIQAMPTGVLLAIALSMPLVLMGVAFYSLHRENRQLAQQNSHLSQAASAVVKELDVLDAEIEILQERAGLTRPSRPDIEVPEDLPIQVQSSAGQPMRPRLPVQEPKIDAENKTVGRSQGGVGMQLAPETLFEVAQLKLGTLASRFHQQVKPALHETLNEEAAQAAAKPKGRPVKAALPISSRFGLRPNPFGRGYELHQGIDFPGPVGTPIFATASGTVKTAEYSGGYGYHVVIDHGYGYSTLYAHLSRLAVAAGASVNQGELIGYLGSTGRSTGPHLHYSVVLSGNAVDPMDYLDQAD